MTPSCKWPVISLAVDALEAKIGLLLTIIFCYLLNFNCKQLKNKQTNQRYETKESQGFISIIS